MAEAPGAKPSVNEASFTGQTQEQFSDRLAKDFRRVVIRYRSRTWTRFRIGAVTEGDSDFLKEPRFVTVAPATK